MPGTRGKCSSAVRGALKSASSCHLGFPPVQRSTHSSKKGQTETIFRLAVGQKQPEMMCNCMNVVACQYHLFYEQAGKVAGFGK